MTYDFDAAYESWSRIPVDDLDYMTSDDLRILSLPQFRELVNETYNIRFAVDGWRNLRGELTDFMGANWAGKHVADVGCGLGLDACWFSRCGAYVNLVDMHPNWLRIAQNTMSVMQGTIPERNVILSPHPPHFFLKDIDLFWSFGVLHHTPAIGTILKRMCECLKPDGEIRVGLYSDKRWTDMIGEPPPADTQSHPRFAEYVGKCDAVGQYADWYNEEKLAALVKPFATVTECRYISNQQFIGAVIKPLEKT